MNAFRSQQFTYSTHRINTFQYILLPPDYHHPPTRLHCSALRQIARAIGREVRKQSCGLSISRTRIVSMVYCPQRKTLL